MPCVQLRQTKNRRRLDRPCRRGNRCALPYLVDAARLCAVESRLIPPVERDERMHSLALPSVLALNAFILLMHEESEAVYLVRDVAG